MSITSIKLDTNREEGQKAEHPLLKCGCAAQSFCSQRGGVKYDPPIPACIIHDCFELADSAPNLAGRIALCTYKGCRDNRRKSTHYGEYGKDGRSCAPSSPDLPFFQHHPDKPNDEFYCGCFGWD